MSSLNRTEPNRTELDPIPSPDVITPPPAALDPAGPEGPKQKKADNPELAAKIDGLIAEMGGVPGSMHARLVHDLVSTSLKLIPDKRDTGELKLITAAV